MSADNIAEQARAVNRWPLGVSMNIDPTFYRSGTGPAGRQAGRVPSLRLRAIHPPRQPAIPDEGRSQKNMPQATAHFESDAYRQGIWRDAMRIRTTQASHK